MPQETHSEILRCERCSLETHFVTALNRHVTSIHVYGDSAGSIYTATSQHSTGVIRADSINDDDLDDAETLGILLKSKRNAMMEPEVPKGITLSERLETRVVNDNYCIPQAAASYRCDISSTNRSTKSGNITFMVNKLL